MNDLRQGLQGADHQHAELLPAASDGSLSLVTRDVTQVMFNRIVVKRAAGLSFLLNQGVHNIPDVRVQAHEQLHSPVVWLDVIVGVYQHLHLDS